MRPIKLIMQAYGSYPDRVEIPFDELGLKNIFLVCGVTGSGKTTIFDAICFALFNKSSGVLRGNETFRSHFAQDNIESFVEFEFLLNGEIYRIKRTPSYYRKKQRGTGEILESSKVELFLPDNKIICNSKEVEEYIIELLGVNDSQFCQIALLAQGEFLKLLNASTQERSEIFRNIFKTKDYQLLQLKLKDEAQKYKNEYDKLKDSILQYISQIETNNVEINEIKNKFVINQVFDELNTFIELVEKENVVHCSILKNNEKSISKFNSRLTDMTILLEKIKLKNELLNKISELKKNDFIFQKDFDEIKKSFDLLDEKNKILITLQEELINLNEEYRKIEELNNIKNALDDIEIKIKNTFLQMSQIIENSYGYQFYEIQELKNKLSISQAEFEKFNQEIKMQTITYDEQYHSYLASQAGILAKNLKENTPCPVCGSKVHPKIANINEEVLSQSQVDELRKQLDVKKSKLNEMSNQCALLIKEVEFKQKTLDDFINEYKLDIKNIAINKVQSDKQIKKDEIFSKQQELIFLNEQKTALVAQSDILVKNISINSIDEFLKIHKAKTDEYNSLSLEIKTIKEKYENITIKKEQNISQISLLEKQLLEYKDISLDENKINEDVSLIKNEIANLLSQNEKVNFVLSLNSRLVADIKEKYENFINISNNYSHYKILSDCANGNTKGKARIAFEQYIQTYYLDMVLFEANKHLRMMTKNQFQLLRKKEALNFQSKTGLDIEVMDFHTFKTRSVKTLSGGESFKATLSLALGLSDCISCLTGAINIDMIFIDEGFGTLDSESLELAMDVILGLSENNKMVGIISHVEDLKSKIENQILSIKTPNGSKIKLTF